jgi:hypothetical protein
MLRGADMSLIERFAEELAKLKRADQAALKAKRKS